MVLKHGVKGYLFIKNKSVSFHTDLFIIKETMEVMIDCHIYYRAYINYIWMHGFDLF